MTLVTGSLELVILRHGSTPTSERRAHTGWLDMPLTKRGFDEARAAGVHPEVELVHTSTLMRSRQTASICFPRATQVAHDDLRERCFGVFQGHTADEMADDADYRTWLDSNREGLCPEGESQSQFIARTAHAIRGIVLDALAADEDRVVLAAHGGTIMAAMTAFARTRRGYYDWLVDPCQGYRVTARFQDGDLVLEDEQRFSTLDFLGDAPGTGREPHEPGSSFFQNRACPHFPCHEGIASRDFNCLFCYCPLYTLGIACSGNFTYTEHGRKDCATCTLPHQGENGVQLVTAHYEQLAALARRRG